MNEAIALRVQKLRDRGIDVGNPIGKETRVAGGVIRQRFEKCVLEAWPGDAEAYALPDLEHLAFFRSALSL